MKTANFLRFATVLALFCAISVSAWADDKERNAEPLEFREITQEVLLRNDVDMSGGMRRFILDNAVDFEDYFVDVSVAMGGYEMLSVDFLKEYVLGVALWETDRETRITPVEVKQNEDYIYFYYTVEKGEKRAYKLSPYCLVALRKPKQGNNFHVLFKQIN